MGVCYARGCENGGSMRCSGCKSAWYCSAECQTMSWSFHKLVCKRHRIEYEDEKQRRAEILATPREKPRRSHCTPCNFKFTNVRGETADGECPDCGYMTCEDCAVHERRGTCYCENSNFGNPYCKWDPQNYHKSSLTWKLYTGDRHPGYGYTMNVEDHPEALEEEPRPCGNCGTVTRCVKLQYL